MGIIGLQRHINITKKPLRVLIWINIREGNMFWISFKIPSTQLHIGRSQPIQKMSGFLRGTGGAAAFA